METYTTAQILKLKTRATYVGALVNIILVVIKLGAGFLGQSTALIADGIHSLSDLASDFFVIVAIKLGERKADYNHPYGHRRFETIATVLLGFWLNIIALGISWDAIERLLNPENLLIPSKNTIGIAMISILLNEWLFRYTKRISKITGSKLLLANAWHHRSDALSSIVVIFGIGSVLIGYPFADAIAAVIVAVMIAKMGFGLVWESINELVDSALPPTNIKEIKQFVQQIPGVIGVHLLRTRYMREDAYVDIHIVVNPRISVSEGHMIGDAVRVNLKTKFTDIVDILVHIDPENDEFEENNKKLLSRLEVKTYLQQYLAKFIHTIDDFRIHYLDGQIEIELVLPYDMFKQEEQFNWVKKQCVIMEKDITIISKISIFLNLNNINNQCANNLNNKI